MPNLEDILLRDTRANQPIATDVAEGTLYYVSDEGFIEQSRSGAWVEYSSAGNTDATYLTETNETADLPNSRRLVAGTDIALDDTTPGELAIVSVIPANLKIRTINLTIDGAGEVLETGIKGYLPIPYDCTILEWIMFADQVGDISLDIWKDIYANFPPTIADSIVAAAPPTLTAADKNQDSTLTGWTVDITAGDILAFNVSSVTTIERISFQLKVAVV